MAALVGDLVPDLSRFRDMIVSPSSRQNQRQQQQQQQQHQQQHHQQQHHQQQHHQQHQHHHKYSPQRQGSPHRRSSSRRRASAALTSRRGDIDASRVDRRNSSGEATRFPPEKTRTPETAADTTPPGGVPPEFPSPPPSSSPQETGTVSPADDANGASMASHQTLRNESTSMNAGARLQQPSPPSSQSQSQSQSFHLPGSSLPSSSSFDRVESPPTQQTWQEPQQTVVHVRDLAHMQSLADAKMLGGNNSTSLDSGNQIKYEISGMPIADVIEMVAALLTKITTTNDLQHDAMQRNVAHQQQANQSSDSGSHMSPLSHSVLAFHGKNVPAITILSYLSRIHKYCPTTYEVFLSLLVYFDRMTERVNEMVMRAHSPPIPLPSAPQRDTTMRDKAAHESDESDSDLADDDDEGDDGGGGGDDDDEMVDSPKAAVAGRDDNSGVVATTDEQAAVMMNPATYFVVDSFNIHRLIISGVTCASKFFSDVFYTNSRYAKVGGLPLAELNHLEIQFLVLNDFRLAVPVEDLEAYATMLVEFYAREVMSQTSAAAGA